jgi:hypothetical protein
MKCRSICLSLALLAACGSSAPKEGEPATAGEPATVDAAYTADIEKLCDVVARSNSTDLDQNDRVFQIATWLSANLTTDHGRKFLTTIQPLKGAAKADALDAEAKRVGLASCALAGEWRR